jgi:hypothetical protein
MNRIFLSTKKITFKFLVCFVVIIFNISIGIINAQSCIDRNATNSQDCLTNNPSNSFYKCCFLASIKDSNKKLCYEMPTSAITDSKIYKYNNELYFINCPNVPKVEILAACGNSDISPIGLGDCSVYSTFAKSCCFNKKTNKCNILETKYLGEITYAGMNLDCGGWNLKFSFGLLISLIVNSLFFI